MLSLMNIPVFFCLGFVPFLQAINESVNIKDLLLLLCDSLLSFFIHRYWYWAYVIFSFGTTARTLTRLSNNFMRFTILSVYIITIMLPRVWVRWLCTIYKQKSLLNLLGHEYTKGQKWKQMLAIIELSGWTVPIYQLLLLLSIEWCKI